MSGCRVSEMNARSLADQRAKLPVLSGCKAQVMWLERIRTPELVKKLVADSLG